MLEDKVLEGLLHDELDAMGTHRIAHMEYWKGDQTERQKLALKRSADKFVQARAATIAHVLQRGIGGDPTSADSARVKGAFFTPTHTLETASS